MAISKEQALNAILVAAKGRRKDPAVAMLDRRLHADRLSAQQAVESVGSVLASKAGRESIKMLSGEKRKKFAGLIEAVVDEAAELSTRPENSQAVAAKAAWSGYETVLLGLTGGSLKPSRTTTIEDAEDRIGELQAIVAALPTRDPNGAELAEAALEQKIMENLEGPQTFSPDVYREMAEAATVIFPGLAELDRIIQVLRDNRMPAEAADALAHRVKQARAETTILAKATMAAFPAEPEFEFRRAQIEAFVQPNGGGTEEIPLDVAASRFLELKSAIEALDQDIAHAEQDILGKPHPGILAGMGATEPTVEPSRWGAGRIAAVAGLAWLGYKAFTSGQQDVAQ